MSDPSFSDVNWIVPAAALIVAVVVLLVAVLA